MSRSRTRRSTDEEEFIICQMTRVHRPRWIESKHQWGESKLEQNGTVKRERINDPKACMLRAFNVSPSHRLFVLQHFIRLRLALVTHLTLHDAALLAIVTQRRQEILAFHYAYHDLVQCRCYSALCSTLFTLCPPHPSFSVRTTHKRTPACQLVSPLVLHYLKCEEERREWMINCMISRRD